MSDHPSKMSGLKDEVVGALKEGAGTVIASDKMKAEGKLQKEGGKAEKEAAKAEKLEKKHDIGEHNLYGKDLDKRAAVAEHQAGKDKEKLGKKTGDKDLEKEGKEQKKIGRDYIEAAIHREKAEGRVDRMQGAAKEAVGQGLDDPVMRKEGENQKNIGKAKIDQDYKHVHPHKDTQVHVVPADRDVIIPTSDKHEVIHHHRVDREDAPERVEVIHHHNRVGGTDVVHVAPTTTEVIHPSGEREVLIPGDEHMQVQHRQKPIIRLIETDTDKHKVIVPPASREATHVVNDKNQKDFNRKEGTADQFEGRAKEHLGKVLGDKDMQEAGREQRKDGKEKRAANQ